MVDLAGKVDLGRLEWVVCAKNEPMKITQSCGLALEGIPRARTGREVNRQEKDTASIRTVTGTHDRRLPVEEIVTDRACGTCRRWVTGEVHELLQKRTCKKRASRDQHAENECALKTFVLPDRESHLVDSLQRHDEKFCGSICLVDKQRVFRLKERDEGRPFA